MGKRRKGKGGSSSKAQSKKENRVPYDEIELYNENFETYYRAQNILPDEEWPVFLEHCKLPLPITFRFTGSNDEASKLSQLFLKTFFSSLPSEASEVSETSETSLPQPTSIPWYPGLAWQMDVSRSIVRKTESYKRFHQFLMTETELGHVARQEAVSMLPPLFLQVAPNHQVIDLCAAPGSKTAQLLEFVQNTEDGCVVANDADPKRAYTLVHQLKRMQSPHLLVTYHPAQHFPSLTCSEEKRKPIQFDRVLADVPCSGDGTVRKNSLIWRSWKPDHGLHLLQCRILMRGIQLAKPGGKIVYSTCTLNPIENEAVVASILSRCQGTVSLADVSHILPNLHRRPGLTHWKVPSLTSPHVLYSKFEEVTDSDRRRITASYFPPSQDLNLHRCIRVYPHLQNTGGFFVAVLEKQSEVDFQGRTSFGETPDDLPIRTFHKRRKGFKKSRDKSPESINDNDDLNEVASDNDSISNNPELSNTEDNPEETAISFSKSCSGAKSDSLEPLTDVVNLNSKDFSKINVSYTEPEENINVIGKPENEPEVEENNPLISTKEVQGHMNQEHYEDPFIFLNEDDDELMAIRSTFGLPADFPFTQLVVRSMTPQHRSIYFCSKSVKRLLQSHYAYKLKVVHTGVKVFARAYEQSLCTHRFNTEGIHLMAPFVHHQIVHIDHDVLLRLLSEERPLLSTLPPLFDNVKKGGLLFKYQQFCFSGWLAPCSVGLLVNKKERQSLLFRFSVPSSA